MLTINTSKTNEPPIELSSNKEIEQKLNYIHENPVEQGFANLDEGY